MSKIFFPKHRRGKAGIETFEGAILDHGRKLGIEIASECGVGAIEGATKNIWITESKVDYETIDGKPAVAICGSGLVDLLAELLREGTRICLSGS